MARISEIKHQLLLSQWTERIHDCQTSGKTVQDWCKSMGVNVKTYYYWLKRVREQALSNLPPEISANLPIGKDHSLVAAKDKVTFKKLEVEALTPNIQSAIIARLPYATLEVANGTSQQTVEAVLLALKAVC